MADNLNDVLSEALAELNAQGQTDNTAPEANASDTNVPEATTTDNVPAANTPEAQAQTQTQAVPETQPQNTSAQTPASNTESAAVDGLSKAAEALSQSQQQNSQLAQQLKEALAAQQQQSQTSQTAIENAVTEQPTVKFDFSELQYLDDSERAAKLSDYMTQLAQSTRESVLKEFEPVINDYKNRQRSAEDEAVMTSISGSGKFPDFKDREGEIKNVINNTPQLQNMEPEQKYTLAYLISKGVQSMNTQSKPRSVDDMVNEISGNPEAMKVLESRRAKNISDTNRDVPIISASSSGTANIPANQEKRPSTLKEAYEQSRKSFGLS